MINIKTVAKVSCWLLMCFISNVGWSQVTFVLPPHLDTVCASPDRIVLSGGLFNGQSHRDGLYFGPGVDTFGTTINSLVAYNSQDPALLTDFIAEVELLFALPNNGGTARATMVIIKDTTKLYRSSSNTNFCSTDSLVLMVLNTWKEETKVRDIIWYKDGVSTGVTGNRFVVRATGIYYPEFTNPLGCRIAILEDSKKKFEFYDPFELAVPDVDEPICKSWQKITGRSDADEATLNEMVMPQLQTEIEARVEIWIKRVTGDAVKVGVVPIKMDGTWEFAWDKRLRHNDTVITRTILMQKHVIEVNDVNSGFNLLNGSIEVPVCYNESKYDTIVVKLCELEIFDVISPNGDGYNDKWIVIDGLVERYPNATVKVYNRFGIEVFGASPYKNDWDGGDLPDAAYYYVLDLKNGKDVFRGTLSIMR